MALWNFKMVINITSFDDLPKITKIIAIWNFLDKTIMQLKISKRYSSYSFHPMSAKRFEDIGYHGEIQAITFLGNPPSFKNFVAFEILTWEPMGKSPRCGISWKWLIVEQNKSLELWVLGNTYVRYLWLISRVWFGVIWCTLQNFQFYRFSKHCPSPNFHPVSSKLYTRYHNHGPIQVVTFLGNLAKITKINILKFFLTQDHIELEISKCPISCKIFIEPIQTFWEHWLAW